VFRSERLVPFLADLRSSGFSVGHNEQQRVVDLLFSLETTGAMPDNSEQLCNMLGAVLCCSAEQQRHFRRQFTSHFGTWTTRRPLSVAPLQLIDEPPPSPQPGARMNWFELLTPAERRMLSRVVSIFVLLLLLLITLNLLHGLGWLQQPPQPPQPPPPAGPSKPTPLTMEWLRQLVGPLALWLKRILPGPYASWIAVNKMFGVGTLFIMLPVFAAIAIWVTAPGRPFSAYLNRRRVDYRPQLVRLLAQTSTVNPFIGRDFNRRAQMLRRPRLMDSRELDVEATLAATLEHGGLFSPVFTRRPVAPEYLVLIDRQTGRDHIAAYAETLVTALHQAHVYVTVYYYNGDIRRLFSSPGSPAATFEEVSARFIEHRLIIIGSGERFFDPVTGNLQPWALLTQAFNRRVFMTPVARELWGYRERSLQAGLQMQVLPLEPESISTMVDQLTSEEPPRVAELPPRESPNMQAAAQLTDLLEDRPVRWVDTGTPSIDSMRTLDQALRRALPIETHRWLAACAVYPELTWNFTVHMGRALGALPTDPHASERLLQLSNLPWFRIGRMPIWLRRALTREMSTELYERVRGILSGLLLTTIAPARKNFAIEAGINRAATASDVNTVESRIAGQLQDPIIIDFMTGLRRQRTAVRLPRVVARLFLEGGWFRNIFSNIQLQDMSASADIINLFLDAARVSAVKVKPREAKDKIGAELRIVTDLLTDTGGAVTPPDTFYLYLPIDARPARLLDEPTISLYRQRRRTVVRLSSLNVGLFLLLAATFYDAALDTMNPAIAVGLATLWLVGPFLMLHFINVRPVVRRIALFPAFHPAGDVQRHFSLEFIRDGARPRPEPATPRAAEVLEISRESPDGSSRQLAETLAKTQYVSDARALIEKLGGNVKYQKKPSYVFSKQEVVVSVFNETHVFDADYAMTQWAIEHLVPQVLQSEHLPS
jgi:hypothetical protein